MDDFMILAKTMKELEERIIQFLKIVEKHNLCFKQSKCSFNMEEILILGVIVGKGTSSDGRRQNQDNERVEDTDQNQRSGEFSGICKLLQKIYQEFQPHGKTVK